jgi:DNA repair protein RadC
MNITEVGELELLRRLLGRGKRRDPAATLLAWAGSLDRLLAAQPRALRDLPGVGSAAVARLEAARELSRRGAALAKTTFKIRSETDVLDWARPRLLPLAHEELWVLSLDGRNGLQGADRVAQGGVSGCAVTPADALRPAVRNAAAAVVVVHNHPSGDPTPSHQDLVMTRQLAAACEILGVALLDHVVVAHAGCTSIATLGLLDAA